MSPTPRPYSPDPPAAEVRDGGLSGEERGHPTQNFGYILSVTQGRPSSSLVTSRPKTVVYVSLRARPRSTVDAVAKEVVTAGRKPNPRPSSSTATSRYALAIDTFA
jgi:hypothetical protein